MSSLSLFLGTVAEALKGPLEVLKRTPFGKKSFLKFTLHYKNCPGPYLATVQFIWVIRLQVNFHSVHCSELDFHKGKTKMDLLHEGFSCVPYPRWFCKLSHLDFPVTSYSYLDYPVTSAFLSFRFSICCGSSLI